MATVWHSQEHAEEDSTRDGKEVSKYMARIYIGLNWLSAVIFRGIVIFRGNNIGMVQLFIVDKYIGEHLSKT
eukprot:5227565-Ditylum_brightwellii.AAC.1